MEDRRLHALFAEIIVESSCRSPSLNAIPTVADYMLPYEAELAAEMFRHRQNVDRA